MDAISEEYVAIAFGIERHCEGFVDAYFGPAELKRRALEGEAASLGILGEHIAALRGQLGASDYPQRRKAYLGAQLTGMATSVRALSGEELPYREQVRGCFDIEPSFVPEHRFEDALERLDELLPGAGPLPERMAAWKKRFEVPADVAFTMIERIAAEARARTLAFVDLPADEHVDFALVSDKPWSGYNWYLGAHRSLVEINTDLPIRANVLPGLVCHEAYPGHHTEHALKEHTLFESKGWGEHAIQLINTPECVISEGIATLADEVVFGHDLAPWMAANLFPLAGIDADPELLVQISEASQSLAALSGNAALLLHEQGKDPEEVMRYIMRYGLRSEKEARQSLRFLSDPLWRAYTFTYDSGRQLLGRWVRRGDRQARFRTLLLEQVYPSLIEQWVLEEEKNCVSG
jgi:hypothetical protein